MAGSTNAPSSSGRRLMQYSGRRRTILSGRRRSFDSRRRIYSSFDSRRRGIYVSGRRRYYSGSLAGENKEDWTEVDKTMRETEKEERAHKIDR